MLSSIRSPFLLSASSYRTLGRCSLPKVVVRSRKSVAEAADNHEDFGDYCIILPKEPLVFGTSHITPRLVPEYIVKPPYATNSHLNSSQDLAPGDMGKVKLGTQEESRLRKSALLARKVRDFAKSLVQVWY